MEGLNLFKDFGLLGIMMGSIILIIFFMIKSMLKSMDDMTKRGCEERKEWQKMFMEMIGALKEHNVQTKEFHDHVRVEHEKMIEALNHLCAMIIK